MRTWKPIEQRKERRLRIAEERKESSAVRVQLAVEQWNPSAYIFDSDAYKTLFVGRLSFLTDEHKLKREMEQVFVDPLSDARIEILYVLFFSLINNAPQHH